MLAGALASGHKPDADRHFGVIARCWKTLKAAEKYFSRPFAKGEQTGQSKRASKTQKKSFAGCCEPSRGTRAATWNTVD